MSDPTLDPDLEQVLEDIAADPRSKLFLTDPRKVLTGLRDGSLETPASRTGLRPAERHLLEVYRHELAFLLRQVYRVELAKRDTVHVQLMPVSASKLHSRITTLLATSVEADSRTQQLRSFSQSSPMELQRVLGASLAVEQAPQTMVCLGNEYFDRRSLVSARRVFGLVLQRPQSPTTQYCTWEGMGLVHEEAGDQIQSLDSYCKAREAALHVSTLDAFTSTSNILRLALCLNSQETAAEAAQWIDDNFSEKNSVFSENVRALNAALGDGPILKNTSLVHSLLESSESPAREVIHAIAG